MSTEYLQDSFDALLLDLDGTVWETGTAIPGAVEAITASSLPTLYVTNNATRHPDAVAKKLHAFGLRATGENILTSAQSAIELAAEQLPAGSRVLVVGTDSFRQLATDAGFVVVHSAEERPAAVLQGLDTEITWQRLTEAVRAITNGASHIASNLDSTLPTPEGPGLGNGSLVAAVANSTGVRPMSAGKPQPAIFRTAVALTGAHAPLAVGDRLDTDIAGARAAGVPSLHVLTGVSKEFDLIAAAPEYRPDFVGADLLALQHPSTKVTPGAHGGFIAEFSGEDIVLSGGDDHATTLDALLTVVDLAWSRPEGMVVPQIQPKGPVATRAVEAFR